MTDSASSPSHNAVPPHTSAPPAPPDHPARARIGRGPLGMVLDLFNSVWLGIALMVLIFLYMTVASAGLVYPTGWDIRPGHDWTYVLVRKLPWIDKTEMEVFAWWPFNTLIALFTINMVVVTIRRIRLNVLNLGVWAIHTGIVILALSSVYYFSAKVEGDTPVFRRKIVIQVPGAGMAQSLVVRPENHVVIEGADGAYEFTIQDINPAWPILSGADKGKTACSVNVAVKTPAQSFVRQMLIDYPQYTEDIIPGQGRAIKATGKKLLDEALQLSFDYEPATHFFLRDTAALFLREVGQREWIERPIDGLPHYADRITDTNDIWQPSDDPPIPANPLSITVPPTSPDDPFGDLSIRVISRLHYVNGEADRWVGGGDRLNPLLRVRIDHPDGSRSFELRAFDPKANTVGEGLIAFRWLRAGDKTFPVGEAAMTILAGPGPTDLAIVTQQSQTPTAIMLGQKIPLGGELSMTATAIIPHAKLERRWVVVPRRFRNSGAGEQLSQIEVAMSYGDWHRRAWLTYNRYAFPNAQYDTPGRFFYTPSSFTLPDGRQIELLFSRKRWPLPAAIALEDFELKTHVGGFVKGNAASVRDFVSILRTYRNGKWGKPFTTSLNSPGSDGGLYFFQSEWDPGMMAFTGLGVGSRQGVYLQLLGCCVAVLGMIYVFYVKPIIKRRRRLKVHHELARHETHTSKPESVEV